jgi:hypothetical protein
MVFYLVQQSFFLQLLASLDGVHQSADGRTTHADLLQVFGLDILKVAGPAKQ